MSYRLPKHLVVAASGWIGRAVGAAAQILMIRLVINYIGATDYAIFAVLVGLVGWFQLADIGLGVSLQNFISESRAKGLSHARVLRSMVTWALVIFCAEEFLLVLMAGWIGPRLLRQFTVPPSAKYQLFLVSSVLLLCFSLGQIVTRIYYAERRGYVANLSLAGAQVIGCVLAWISLCMRWAFPLVWAIGAFLLPSALVMLGLLLGILARPAPGPPSAGESRHLISRRAIGFAGLSLSTAFVLHIDIVVISQFLDPKDIAGYTLISKIMAFMFVLYSEALLALWPLVTERLAVPDVMGIRRWIQIYLFSGALLVMVASLAMFLMGNRLLEVLAPRSGIQIARPLLALFSVYYLLRVWCDTFAMLLQSMSKLFYLWVAVPVQGALSLGLQLILAPRFGAVGVLSALTLSFLLTVAWVLPLAVRREIFRRSLNNY